MLLVLKSTLDTGFSIRPTQNTSSVDVANESLVDVANESLVDVANESLVDEANESLVDEANEMFNHCVGRKRCMVH